MAALKSFKDVIITIEEREIVWEVLDSILTDWQKNYVIGKVAMLLPADRIENQMEIVFSDPVKQKHDEKPDMHSRMGSTAQGKT